MPKTKNDQKKENQPQKPKTAKLAFYTAVGRRKTAKARVRLQVGSTGKFIVNKKSVEEYFPGEIAKKKYLTPLTLTGSLGRFDIFVTVEGGGKFAQLDALVHGLSRALQIVDRDAFRPILKKQGLLTRDARARERRKAGLAGKARKKKQSPKR